MPVFSATKAEAVYQELRSRILDGSLKPGSGLDQKALATQYRISTTPIREALRRLESEQLVIVKAHHGPRVSPLSVQELHYLFAVRLELDPLAGRLAAEAPEATRRATGKLLLERSWQNSAERVQVNRQFHRAIYESCGNPVLAQILESLWNRCDRYRFLLLSEQDADFGEEEAEHTAMANALEAGDGALLEQLLRQHIKHSYAKLAALAEEFTALQPAAND